MANEEELPGRDIVYIRTEPMAALVPCHYVNAANFRCTIELADGSTIMRCGYSVQHALANAVACYKTAARTAPTTPHDRTEGQPGDQ